MKFEVGNCPEMEIVELQVLVEAQPSFQNNLQFGILCHHFSQSWFWIRVDHERPEWLPEDWKVVVEVRNGKKYKYYINKSNGLRFYSKPDVLRYLESSEKKPEKLNKFDIERIVAENLPTGWIKETRTKKNGGKTRSKEFYIDPDTGHYFNSLLELFRYLETKDSGKPESKPDDKDHIKAEVEDRSQFISVKAQGQMSIDKKEDGSSTRHKSVNSELELAGDSKGNTLNDIMADPCIDYAFKILTDAIPMELAIKTLTTAIPIDDVKKVGENAMSSTASPNNQTAASSSVLPYDNVWTDPCFEHAIKMFTDEIAKDGGLSDSSFHHDDEGERGKFS